MLCGERHGKRQWLGLVAGAPCCFGRCPSACPSACTRQLSSACPSARRGAPMLHPCTPHPHPTQRTGPTLPTLPPNSVARTLPKLLCPPLAPHPLESNPAPTPYPSCWGAQGHPALATKRGPPEPSGATGRQPRSCRAASAFAPAKWAGHSTDAFRPSSAPTEPSSAAPNPKAPVGLERTPMAANSSTLARHRASPSTQPHLTHTPTTPVLAMPREGLAASWDVHFDGGGIDRGEALARPGTGCAQR